MFSTVLAAVDISQVIGVCVLVISFLSWFVNVIKGNTPDGVPKSKSKPQSGRSEIEALLQQLSGEKPKPKPERRESQKPERRDSSQSRPPSPQDRGKNKSKLPVPRPSTSRPTPRVADTHLGNSNLGSDVRSHRLGNRVEATVKQDITSSVQQDIQDAVQRDLGNGMAALPVREKAVHPLVSVLRDPNGVRQAVLLNEILQSPRGKRR